MNGLIADAITCKNYSSDMTLVQEKLQNWFWVCDRNEKACNDVTHSNSLSEKELFLKTINYRLTDYSVLYTIFHKGIHREKFLHTRGLVDTMDKV